MKFLVKNHYTKRQFLLPNYLISVDKTIYTNIYIGKFRQHYIVSSDLLLRF